MMGYLIDTNIIIYSLKNDKSVNDKFEEYINIPKAISAITYGELFYGAKKSKMQEKNMAVVHRISELFPIIDVTKSIIETFGDLKAFLEKKGERIDDFDLLIGSTALTMNYTLVTNNVAHFKRIPGLKIENWAR
jgi:tRNA(fMet)-specific endonuclease VapC